MRVHAVAKTMAEWSFKSQKARKDPWGEISLTVNITSDDGRTWAVPAFWAGDQDWRIRFTPARPGTFRFKTECSDAADGGLHNIEGVIEAAPAARDSENVFIRHGAVRVAAGHKGFEHEDGTPFLWLADTWWMLMTGRVSWPDGFRTLTADRVKKGFTVVQTVVGFQPDAAPFDGQDSNAGGSPWEKDFARINPRYFDECDLKIEWLVRSGILPCILGGWGYHLLMMTEERMRLHWKYIVARYGAYPVVWTLAGEVAMPFYLSKDGQGDTQRQKEAWTRIAKFIRGTDAFHRPLSAHPRYRSWEDLVDPSVLDYHMFQAGHFGAHSLEACSKCIQETRAGYPDVPIICAEPPYEQHMGFNGADVQRYAFWASMLSGAAGFTYGAAGIFQANDKDRPAGKKPGGGAYDGVFWDEAMHFPGSTHVSKAKALLAELPYWELEPHPEWAQVAPAWGHEHSKPPLRLFAGGVPGKWRIVYIPARYYDWNGPRILACEPGVKYRAWYFNTTSGELLELGDVKPDKEGCWQAPIVPFLFDWVLVMK